MHSLLESAEGSFGISSELKVLRVVQTAKPVIFHTSDTRGAPQTQQKCQVGLDARCCARGSTISERKRLSAHFHHSFICGSVYTLCSLTCSTRNTEVVRATGVDKVKLKDIMYRRKHGQKEAFC